MIKAILTYNIDDLWASKEELDQMTDGEIIELLREDRVHVFEHAKWQIARSKEVE